MLTSRMVGQKRIVIGFIYISSLDTRIARHRFLVYILINVPNAWFMLY